ncbi:hypothetical protein COBT_003179, partial [Conglomerata obtusa]
MGFNKHSLLNNNSRDICLNRGAAQSNNHAPRHPHHLSSIMNGSPFDTYLIK